MCNYNTGGVGDRLLVVPLETHMVSEFDLPCTNCGHDLARTTLPTTGDRGVTVAECQNCGTRHYPEAALGRF